MRSNKELKLTELINTTAILAETVGHLVKGKLDLNTVLQELKE